MSILKVMLAVAIGTYVAYEFTIRNKKVGSGNNRKLESSYNKVPTRL